MNNQIYLSYDGDGCGRKVGQAVMRNSEEDLREISAKIDLGHEIVKHWVTEHGGQVISGGGDEGTFKLPEEVLDSVESLRKDYHFATGITISVGIGNSLSEAGRSLLAAKFRGKDQIAHYDESVDKDIEMARKRVKKGNATQEEYKLAEAYLEKAENNMGNEQDLGHQDCPYCAETDGVDPNHCRYCHEAEAAEDAHCPFCEENVQKIAEDDCVYCQQGPSHDSSCPYCAESSKNVPIQSPDSNNSVAAPGSPEEKAQYDQMEMNPPAIGKPEIGNNSSPAGIGQSNMAYDTAGAPVMPANAEGSELDNQNGIIPEEGANSKEAMQAIAQHIAGETEEGLPDEKAMAEGIDDTAIVGDEMDGNASRPENFGSNVPGDVGTASETVGSDEPDLSQVLQEGLDSEADDIQKERVREMVGQALQGFKAAKNVLEQAKEQAPGLYSSSIMMLKAMIEMAKMLGLGQEQGSIEDVAQPTEENEWHDPFPAHPDNGGELRPQHLAAAPGDAAVDPKAVRQ